MVQTDNLIIEVTRKCNMRCSHCLRGGVQKMDIDHKFIDSIMNQIDFIPTLTITGGEPSLNVEAIEYILSSIKKRNIELGSFYIATNGKNVKLDFVQACLKLYAYSTEKEYCKIEVSNDYYHNQEGGYNDELLQGLSFYGKRNERDNAEYNLISEGRAVNNYRANRKLKDEKHEILSQEDFRCGEIYLNCKGEIINGCDWSYKNQKNNIICLVENLTKYYDNLPEE